MGLGVHLLSALIDLARQSGVRRLFGSTLSENGPMLRLARRFGFKRSLEPGAAILTRLSLALRPDA
jgi:acetyltransferase